MTSLRALLVIGLYVRINGIYSPHLATPLVPARDVNVRGIKKRGLLVLSVMEVSKDKYQSDLSRPLGFYIDDPPRIFGARVRRIRNEVTE